MKKAIAFAVAMAAAGAANAEWLSGGTGGEPSGELMLTVWDSVAEVAYSQDLGVLAATALSGNLASGFTFDLSAAGIAHLGGVANADNIQWNIAGANYDYSSLSGPQDANQLGWYTTGAMPTQLKDQGQFNALQSRLFDLENNLGAPLTAADDAAYLTSGNLAQAGDNNIWGNEMGGLIFDFGIASSSAGNGESLVAWAMNYAFGAGLEPQLEQAAGLWTLDVNAGTLVYEVATSEVPLPAAAWLFGSAVLGMAGIGRKRKA